MRGALVLALAWPWFWLWLCGAEGCSGSSQCWCPGLHLRVLSLLPQVPHSAFPRSPQVLSACWRLPAVLPSLWESRSSKSWRCPLLCSMGAPAQPLCVHVSVCPPPVPCPALPSSGVTRHCSQAVGRSLHRRFSLGSQPLLMQTCYRITES